jgi:hypothetical protein
VLDDQIFGTNGACMVCGLLPSLDELHDRLEDLLRTPCVVLNHLSRADRGHGARAPARAAPGDGLPLAVDPAHGARPADDRVRMCHVVPTPGDGGCGRRSTGFLDPDLLRG